MYERIKTLEIDKHETYDKISTYEDLLQQGRYKLKNYYENRVKI